MMRTIGASKSATAPFHSERVRRVICTPWRSKICSSRYNGRCSEYLEVTTCANNPGPLEQRLKSALAELKGSDRGKGLRLLKIYRLAQKVVCWSRDEYEPDLSALPEPLKFLGDKVVKGDTW